MADNLEEIKYEIEEEKSDPFKNILKGISEKYFFAIIVAVLVAIYMVNQGIMTFQQIILYIGIAVIAIMFMSYRGFQGETYISYSDALALAETFLKDMQRMRKIDFGTIKVSAQGRLRKFGKTPSEYTVHAQVRTNEFLVSDYEIIVDPIKNGLGIIGVVKAKRGFDPLRKPEIVFQASPDMFLERQRRIYSETGEFDTRG